MTTNLIAALIVAFALVQCATIATTHSRRLSWADISDSRMLLVSDSGPCSQCARWE